MTRHYDLGIPTPSESWKFDRQLSLTALLRWKKTLMPSLWLRSVCPLIAVTVLRYQDRGAIRLTRHSRRCNEVLSYSFLHPFQCPLENTSEWNDFIVPQISLTRIHFEPPVRSRTWLRIASLNSLTRHEADASSAFVINDRIWPLRLPSCLCCVTTWRQRRAICKQQGRRIFHLTYLLIVYLG